MPQVLLNLLSTLRPRADRLSEETCLQVQMHRLMSLIGALFVLGFGPLYALSNPGATDPLWARLGVAGLFAAFFVASYMSRLVRRHFVSCIWAILYVLMGWFAVLTALNHFSVDYTTGLLLVYAVLSAVVGFGTRSMGPMLWFLGYGLLLVIGGALAGPPPDASPLVLLASMGTIAIVEGILTRGWLEMRATIHEQESRLRGLTNSLPGVVFQFYAREDGSVGHHFVSDHAEEVLGINADPDTFHERCLECIPESARGEMERSIERAIEEETRWELEAPFDRPDGTRIWALGAAVPERRENEIVFNGVILDITDRKRAERALEEERDRFETLFEALPTPVIRCIAEDGKALVSDANPAFESAFGLSVPDVEGQEVNDLIVPEEEKDPAHQLHRRALEDGTLRTEVRRTAADGVRDYQLRAASRHPEDGPPEIYAIYADITERKEAEDQVRRSRERYQSLFRDSHDAILVHDLEGRVKEANPQAETLFGRGADELEGQSVRTLHPPGEKETAQDKLTTLRAGNDYHSVSRYVRADGSPFWGEVFASAADVGGETVVRSLIRDVTEREVRRQEREDHLEALSAAIPGAAFEARIGPSGERSVKFIGAEVKSLLGLSAESENLWDALLEQIPASHRNGVLKSIEEAVENRTRWQREIPFDRPGEDRIWLLGSSRPSVEGKEIVFKGTLLDITDRKKRKQALRERQDKIEALYEMANRLLRASSEEEVAEVLVRLVQEALGYRGVSVHLAGNGTLAMSQTSEMPPELRPLPPNFSVDGESVVAEAYQTGETLVVEDLEAAGMEDPMEQGDLRSAVVVPMERHGVLSVASPEPRAVGEFDRHMVEVLGAYGTAVLDRLGQEEALREERDLLNRLLATSPAAIMMADEGGQFVYANEQAEEVMGIGGAEITERAFDDPAWSITAVDGTPLPECDLPFAQVISTGEPVRDAQHAIEWPDGTQRILSVSGAPLRNADGSIEGALFHANDVTEQKHRMATRRERQNKVEALYEATNRLLQAEDEEDLSVRLSSLVSTTLGYPATTVRLVKGDELVPAYVPSVVQDHMPKRPPYDIDGDTPAAKAHQAGETQAFEDLSAETGMTDRGDIRATAYVPMGSYGLISVGSFEASGIATFDLHLLEVLAGYAALVLDRLEREESLREAKIEAEEASRMQSAFLANVGHEIRTPLTSIIGFAESIGKEAGDLELPSGSPIGTHAGLIEQSGKRLLKTLNGVLTLSKLEAGQMDLRAEPVELEAEARRTAEELGPKAQEKGIDLHLEVEDVWARADEGGVQIVIQNLLINAIKYTEEDGTIWVRTYREEARGVLEVEDTGIGMEPEKAELLFEPFRQASEGFGREYEGTGVGLAVTQKAIEQMGGTLEVDTEKGEGSCFTAWLPRAENGGTERFVAEPQ